METTTISVLADVGVSLVVMAAVVVGCLEVELVGSCGDVLVLTGISLAGFVAVCSVRLCVVVVQMYSQLSWFLVQ